MWPRMGRGVKDLGAGIGGKIVLITGRLVQYPEENHIDYYIHVTSLDVVGGPQDGLELEEVE